MAKSKIYKVARGRSVLEPHTSRLFKSYETFPHEKFSDYQVAQLVKDGAIVERGGETPPIPNPPILQVDGTLKRDEQNPEHQRSAPVGLWNFDPAKLRADPKDPAKHPGKNIEELNAMVLEIDDKEEPFTTVEEAIAHLSQNFKK